MERKTIFVSFSFFIIGVILSFFLESTFRSLVLNIYQWTTNNGIQFHGKNLYLLSSPIFYLGFGLFFSVLTLNMYFHSTAKAAIKAITPLFIFMLILTGIIGLDANFKIMECTLCDEGIRYLRYSEVNHGLIVGISFILSTVPILIQIIKRVRSNA